MDNKNQLRIEIKRELKEISSVRRQKEEAYLYREVTNLVEWQKADLILGYLSFGEEFSVDKLLEIGLAEGKRVAVPKVMGRHLDFFVVEDLSPDRFELRRGIREPKKFCEERGIAEIKERESVILKQFNSPLILVPGLAFSKNGDRLGRGGGFYDKYLTRFAYLYSLGICFSDQIRGVIPVNEDDKSVDKVIYSSL